MTLRTVTYDTATHKIVPIEPFPEQIEAMGDSKAEDENGDFPILADILDGGGVNDTYVVLAKAYKDAIAAAPEYQEPDIRAKLAVNMIKYLGATKTQAKTIIDGVFDGEHTINESDLKYQEPTKD